MTKFNIHTNCEQTLTKYSMKVVPLREAILQQLWHKNLLDAGT
jgi:hypothetical protein